jgi:hypothetical protein
MGFWSKLREKSEQQSQSKKNSALEQGKRQSDRWRATQKRMRDMHKRP